MPPPAFGRGGASATPAAPPSHDASPRPLRRLPRTPRQCRRSRPRGLRRPSSASCRAPAGTRATLRAASRATASAAGPRVAPSATSARGQGHRGERAVGSFARRTLGLHPRTARTSSRRIQASGAPPRARCCSTGSSGSTPHQASARCHGPGIQATISATAACQVRTQPGFDLVRGWAWPGEAVHPAAQRAGTHGVSSKALKSRVDSRCCHCASVARRP